MENASKALLIAGSVLIVILLIAMGVRVFTSTSGTTDQVEGTMQSTEIAQFNSKFTQYAGEKKSAAQVKALANVVIANNATSSRKVSFAGKTSPSDISTIMGSYTSSYTITVQDTNNDGYVDTISIT